MKYHVFERHGGDDSGLTDIDLAWTAGFMDGESSLTFRCGTAVVRISNCHLPTLQKLCRWFGGSIAVMFRGTKERRPAFGWAVSGPRARRLLIRTLPFLDEKRPQAEAILAEPLHRKGVPLTREDWARRKALRETLRIMKRPRYYPQLGQ